MIYIGLLIAFAGGVAVGLLISRVRPEQEPEEVQTEEEERIDRQWEDLMRFDGKQQ